ncbi:MAG: hypothetical protein IH889_03545 [Planctomycetes bacterium]|nr:hypothetical protein [Planctomycetota bacterium]
MLSVHRQEARRRRVPRPGSTPPSLPCENCSAANLAVADISGAAMVPDGCVDAFDLAKLLAEWCSVAGGNPCGTCQ